MRRWETFTALAAVVLASASALHIHDRLFFALLAIVLIAVVGMSRLRASFVQRRGQESSFDAESRARRIREQRNKR